MAMTWIFFAASSGRIDSVNPCTANLDAQYAALNGKPRLPTMDETKTICPPAVFFQVRSGRPHAVEAPHEIDLHGLADILLGIFEDGPFGRGNARVIDHDVQTAELGDGALNEHFYLEAARDVGRHRQRGTAAGANLRGVFFDQRGIARGQDDLGLLSGQLERQLPADPARGAGDDDDFIFKIHLETQSARHTVWRALWNRK